MYFGTSCSSIVRPFTLCQSLTYLNPCENVIFTILPLQNLPLSWRNLIGSLCNHVTWRMVEVVFLPACIGPCEQMTCSRKYLNECGNLNIKIFFFGPKGTFKCACQIIGVTDMWSHRKYTFYDKQNLKPT